MRLIDADALMKDINDSLDEMIKLHIVVDDAWLWAKLDDALENLPTFELEQKKGKWERHNTYHGDDTSGFVDPDWRCSECGEQANVNVWSLYDLTNFCPNCGAEMEKEND